MGRVGGGGEVSLSNLSFFFNYSFIFFFFLFFSSPSVLNGCKRDKSEFSNKRGKIFRFKSAFSPPFPFGLFALKRDRTSGISFFFSFSFFFRKKLAV